MKALTIMLLLSASQSPMRWRTPRRNGFVRRQVKALYTLQNEHTNFRNATVLEQQKRRGMTRLIHQELPLQLRQREVCLLFPRISVP
jgi:hypothetical protein